MATNRKYPPEVMEWAVRTVLDWRAARNTTKGGIDEVAEKIGVHPDTLRNWVKIAELERENRELRRVNELLKEASSPGG